MIDTLLVQEMEQHFKKDAPREACGVLVSDNNTVKYIPVTNVAKDKDDFLMSTDEYLDIYYSKEIVGIVHSHVNATCNPSVYDIKQCNATQIPYYIFSYPQMDMYLLNPEKF